MAKRTKRATARKAKARTKVAKRAKTTKRRAAKQLIKTKPKRQKLNAEPRGPVAKKSTSRRHKTPTQQSTLQTETTIVDVIEEPFPGVLVVTEFVETHIKPDMTKRLEIDQTAGPESEEK
jgi:fructose-1,6-bisphosphatase/inositol monophosphatase family enzyme